MPTSAQVSVRFSVQDQEVVKKALADLGKDGEAALKKLDAASRTPSAGLTAMSAVIKEAKDKVGDASGELGIFGTVLRGLGPVGLVAAGAVGAVVAVIYEMKKRADEFGDKAIVLNTFAEAAGVSARNVQALGEEGKKFSLDSEKIATGIEKFAVNVEALRKGTGPLFEELTRISPALRDQLAAAKDTGAAYDLAGRAINQTTDAIQRNALARALFGRGAAAQGLLAGDVASQGGLNEVGKHFADAGKAIDEGLLKSVAKLRVDIKATEENTRLLMDSLYSEDVLQRQKQFADIQNEIARGLVVRHRLGVGADQYGISLENEPPEAALVGRAWTGAPSQRERGLDMLAAGRGAKPGQSDIDAYNRLADARAGTSGAGAPGAVEQVAEAAKKGTAPLQEQLAVMRLWMGVLGAAATPAEKLKEKQLELAVAVKNHHVNTEQAARAQAAFNLVLDASAVSIRERLGLASREEIQAIARRQLNEDATKGYIKNAAERATADAVSARQTKAAFEQVQVTASALPQLTRFSIDAQDSLKAVDQVTTSSLASAGNALVDFETGTKRGGDAVHAFTTAAERDFLQMLNKMLLLGPAAERLKTALSGAGGFNLFGLLNGGGAADAGKAAYESALGNVMTSRGAMVLHRYAAGGVATSPQVSIFGEGKQNEAYVPLPDGRSIPVSINMGGGGKAASAAPSGGNVHIHNYTGADVSAQHAPNQAGGTDLHLTVCNAARGIFQDDIMNGGPMAHALERRYGLDRTRGLAQ